MPFGLSAWKTNLRIDGKQELNWGFSSFFPFNFCSIFDYCIDSITHLVPIQTWNVYTQKESWIMLWNFPYFLKYYPNSSLLRSTSRTLSSFPEIYSVGGRECLADLVIDPDAHYWYCQTDTSDWDYCCRPGSTCGYSNGYDFAW